MLNAILIFSTTCLALLHSLAVAASNSVYVSPSGEDDRKCGGGTLQNPYFTLSTALDCAAAGDIIYMAGGEYSYSKIVDITKSITIKASPGESPRILIVGTELPFFAMQGSFDFVFEDIAVSGFNVNGQNIPCSSFIYNFPGKALGRVTLNNIDFQNWYSYDSYPERSNVINGMFEALTVSNSTFTTSSVYYTPGTHINAGATSIMTVTGNIFSQPPRLAFILDSSDSRATATVVLSGNVFAAAGSSVRIEQAHSSYLIQDSSFVNSAASGPTCNGKSAKITMERVSFENSTKPALIVSNGCTATMIDSRVIDSFAGSYLLQCGDASLSISGSFFSDDENLSQCNNCQFESDKNDITGVAEGVYGVGTCPF